MNVVQRGWLFTELIGFRRFIIVNRFLPEGRFVDVLSNFLMIYIDFNKTQKPLRRRRHRPPPWREGCGNDPRWRRRDPERSPRRPPHAQESTLPVIIVVSRPGVSFTRRPGDTYNNNKCLISMLKVVSILCFFHKMVFIWISVALAQLVGCWIIVR